VQNIYYDKETDAINFDGSTGVLIGWIDNEEEVLRQDL
jgi:hypothetical protein